jgi:hypothetical protein
VGVKKFVQGSNKHLACHANRLDKPLFVNYLFRRNRCLAPMQRGPGIERTTPVRTGKARQPTPTAGN